VTERDELEGEREFHDFLKRRRSPFPTEPDAMEPPESVDRWVLQRARDGIRVSEQPRPIKTSSWAIPFATAATVVIAVGLFLNVDQQPPAQSTSEVAAVAAARDTTETGRDDVPAGDSAVTVDLQADRYDEQYGAQNAPELAAPPATARVERQRNADKTQVAARAAASALAEVAPPPPVPPVTNAPAATAADAAGSAPVVKVPETELRAEADRSFAVAASTAQSERVDSREERSVGDATSAVAKQSGFRSDPNQWWAEIERLRAVGDDEKMEFELSEFRKAYPDDQRGILAPAKP
jgi:hypothetical protein